MVKVDTDLHHQYRISFTNYVKIASKTEKSLTAEQMIEGKQQLVELIDKWEPEVICFLGALRILMKKRNSIGESL
ncbi:hypothetical protein RO3G_08822 [Rhizopus delemar RA 99-880]|uniref:Uncharacterized protein n=1 Tax=Rhizopus delemar (strain RA 99-880 / ATCC MYA-4621 / FGSC 9543 / NRRL 43880) TaxID=246409 RepID=I1C6N2_RHIO9|nr:hypothetical protein RO3G_08822 [Rhizopus delemar RA 99-880]|eukprot:EIE84112.1 hypothetical protein RO3G_08822 [Rhizopus delemar RA 99-880]